MSQIMCHQETLYRLCIFCRTLEPMNGPCAVLQGEKSRISQTGRNVESDTLVSGLSPQDAELISALHQQPSSLCARCSAYDILGVLLKSDPTADPRQEYETQSFNDFTRSMLHVGRPSSVTLTASCPICRLFYCVLPRKYEPVRQITNGRKITRTTEADIYFEPRRTYLRLRNWDTLPKYLRKQCAVVLHMTESYLESSISRNSMPFSPSHSLTEKPRIYAPTIALEPRLAPPDRKLNSLRPISSNVDFSLLRQALGLCLEKHCTSCSTQKQKRPELLETRMIDIVERIVVPCPPDCDYVALSYVWGGVEPSPGSLKNRCLPQTIEDAITVTQALGRRYLWVDALCINQSEELTSSERKEKEKQLRWMGIIYGGATVTIVAVSGLNANAGLHGISVPRLAQVTENIDGYTLFTSPPSYFTETSETLWSRRAWTMQEHLLSKRLLFFSQSQVAFECREGLFEEVLHYTTKGDTIIDDTPHPSTSEDSLTRFLYGDEVNPDSDETPWRRLLIFSRLLGIYTIRQMTKESDSINAFRGMLTTLGAQLFPGGFVHGLPLKSHPNSLAWMHLDGVIPQRRAQFPSWSWAGWEGAVVFPEKLLANSDINAASENFTNIDLGSQFLASEGNEISVEGWVVYLDVRTDPLSELFVPGQRDSVGTVKEGHSFHNNTLNTGIYTCLVIQRLAEPTWGLDSRREIVFLLALQQTGSKIQRRTQLTVTLFRSQSFDQIPREKKVLQLT